MILKMAGDKVFEEVISAYDSNTKPVKYLR